MQVKLLRFLQEDTFDAALPWHHGGHGEGRSVFMAAGCRTASGLRLPEAQHHLMPLWLHAQHPVASINQGQGRGDVA